MKVSMYIFLVVFLSLFGCWETNNPPQEKIILWETEVVKNNNTFINQIYPLIFDDNVVISRGNFHGSLSALVCYSKRTGEKKWEWSDTYTNSEGNVLNIELHTKALVYNNIIIGLDGKRIYGINSETGETVWKTVFEDQIRDRFYLFEDKIYCMSKENLKHNKLIYYVLDPNTGSYNTLYELPGYEEGYNILSSPFHIFNNKEGENCLLIGIAHVKDKYMPTETWKYGMMCYNLDKKEIIFKQSYSFEVGLSNLYIHDDKIYSTGNYFSEFDLASGKLIKQFKQDQSTIDYTTLYDYPYAYLMYNNTTNRLVKVNMITGKEVGRTSLNGHQCYYFLKRDNKLYLSARDGKIYIVNTDSFDIEETIIAPHYHEDNYLVFDEFLSFDEETGYMYCTDFKHLICYDLDK